MKRRTFARNSILTVAGTTLLPQILSSAPSKMRLAMVGTGIRGITFWGKSVQDNYKDTMEFVGLCDINPGRVQFAQKYIGVQCLVFTDFELMVKTTKPDTVIVTTVDATHHEYIVKALEMGVNVMTEKPMTTDEVKCKAILDAEKRTGKKVIVGFNYRYGTLFTAIKEQLAKNVIGETVSVDFNWYLNVYHGADYFRRWHAYKAKGGTLLVHKSTHHFDLMNWLIDSDPVEVMAYGSLDHYGKNGKYRATHCRVCNYKNECKFYNNITNDAMKMDLYVANEKHDGYLRDACVFREDIDIYDKMSVQVKYANGVLLNYSLTTYSPYEGWRLAFNGKEGRLDSTEGIPWENDAVNQELLHAKEFAQNSAQTQEYYERIYINKNFDKHELIKVPLSKGGHGGGDARLHDKIFKNPNSPDPYRHAAGTRDGAMSILVGIAARKSIEEKRIVKINELTDIVLMAKRP
ncbi:MAG: Gfo/Idh/MocA family oxidoreductase [Cytophagales bacterium]|nr:Gfo/Idh/MocA family oxidoreductase [Cytophagales bacterium]